MGIHSSQPYRGLGARIKHLRERANESLLEVSGAVEIDEATLEQIESGVQLPDEDVLSLLMNHFGVSDSDAVKLWELAGYGKNSESQVDEQLLKQIMMVIPFDNRVAFTDTANIDANSEGLVINFTLSAGNTRPQTVSRVGMSINQAQKLISNIQTAIDVATQPSLPKALPAPTQKQTKKTEKKNNP